MTIKIGSRESKLALAQAYLVRDEIIAKFPEIGDVEIVKIKTSGDKFLDKNLSLIGGKGLFTKEIEEALLEKKIDLAVHSAKDLPAEMPSGLVIKAMLKREEVNDVFVSHKYPNLASVPEGAVIGTSSIRRKAILLNYRNDLNIIDFRGNIHTRLQKLETENIDGIILALAGLKRAGLESKITEKIPAKLMLPAIGQGAIGVQSRDDDQKILTILNKLNHLETEFLVNLERKFMAEIDGSCKTPIACLAEMHNNKVRIRALIIHPDGSIKYFLENITDIEKAESVIMSMIEKIKYDAAEIIEYIKKYVG